MKRKISLFINYFFSRENINNRFFVFTYCEKLKYVMHTTKIFIDIKMCVRNVSKYVIMSN